MKIMIASDIHGSAACCEKMLALYNALGAERLLLLGDILYHGPRNDLPNGYTPKSVAEQLNGIKDKIICVRGNCDAEVDAMVLDFPIMSDYTMLYCDKILFYATHGHIYGENRMPCLERGSVLLEGHTHIPKLTEKNGVYCMNPGSVSIPKGGSTNSVMLYEDRTFKWLDLDGNVYKEFTVPEI